MQREESHRLSSKEFEQGEIFKPWKSVELKEYDSEEVVRFPVSLFDSLVHRNYRSEELQRDFGQFGLGSSLKRPQNVIVPEQVEEEDQFQPVENSPQSQNYALQQQPQSGVGCNCRKCACKKAYCACWNKGISCTQKCNCINCHNQPNKESFYATPKKPIFSGTQKCACRNNKCKKKHCSCHQGNRKCNSSCQCVGCENMDAGMSSSRSISTRSVKIGSESKRE